MAQPWRLGSDIIKEEMHAAGTSYLSASNILKLLPHAACVCDATGVIVSYNNKAVEIWGRAPQPAESYQHFYEIFKLHNAHGEEILIEDTPLPDCLRDGKHCAPFEIAMQTPGSFQRTVRITATPLVNEDGNVTGMINSFDEVTRQRLIEKELDIKSRELTDYIENASIGLHWIDANGIIKWANKTEYELLGYTADEYIGHHISEFHANEKEIRDILERLHADETLKAYEAVLRCKDGSTRIVQISSNVLWEGDKFIHTRCFTVDVTEEKKLYKALKKSESRYSQLVSKLKAAIYITDADGYITFFNQAAADLWGRKPEIGKEKWCGALRMYDTEGREIDKDVSPLAVAVNQLHSPSITETVIARPDGSFRNLVQHPQLITDDTGKVLEAVNLLMDITNIKESRKRLLEGEKKLHMFINDLEAMVEERTRDIRTRNEELKKSEERYYKMIEEVEDYAIVLLDENGIIQNWNKGAEKIKGYKEEEIVGKSFSTFYRHEDRTKNLPETLLNQARVTGKALHEGWRLRKDGSTFWGSIVITALHDSDNNIVGFSKVTRDLTEPKAAEDKAREDNNQLEFQNRELQQFAYAASHDMKEPLRKINFYNSFVLEMSADQLNEKSKEYLNRSIIAVKRMTSLIDDLLSYSQTNFNVDSFIDTDLNELMEEIVLMHKDMLEGELATFQVDNLPVIPVIPFQFRQLFDNLINNSLKYKHPDRNPVIKVTAEKVSGYQAQSSEVDPAALYHKISVIDNGLGFDPAYAEKIFEIFQRLTNQSGYEGSGIGLAICKKIVQNHRGIIKASSVENKGARFDIYIPVK